MGITGKGKVFLFLQGPHGPWFKLLSRMIARSGAEVWRIGFNLGDEFFWPDRDRYIPWHGAADDWPAELARIFAEKGVTDIVLYGDTRPVHAMAVEQARKAGITVHVFEEGYLRPHWITYERGGSNGHSRLVDLTLPEMTEALADRDAELPDAPARWGDMREHVFYGALYHGLVLAGGRRYPAFRSHRDVSGWAEFRLYLQRLALMPWHRLERVIATGRIRRGGFPYFLALLQLEHDASFRSHGPFASQVDFAALCIDGFAKGAAPHHHLVFKAHPLEDGRAPLSREIRRLAREAGIGDRVHFVRGGKLARLLNDARGAVTVNSTAAQQVLWRGLPLKIFGRAVYGKPEFVSSQPIAEFFAQPSRPDSRAYRDFRRYLLETSQVPGGFYSKRGRRALLRQVVDMMLAAEDPYDALTMGTATPRQQLRLVT